MNYYPLERNVCELKVGSSTYPMNRLQFLNGKERDRHALEDQAFKDFAFKSHKMCEEKMLVEEFGIRGAAAMFKVAGVNIVITRHNTGCLRKKSFIIHL